ncbi:flagellar type III secretion system pore protein FliP [Derxia lacustris]|uniref:flagellar type III secretion system pore protein FliP n=1 Tax=Derxia lacustris TaxID=764842 RepID=UPI001EEB82FF|nr:flagellar type III secretion system pore protein FliP [Derxia lacustris]
MRYLSLMLPTESTDAPPEQHPHDPDAAELAAAASRTRRQRQLRRAGLALGLLALIALPLLASAQTAAPSPSPIPGVTATPGAGGSTNYSVPVQTLLFFTALGFIPAALLLMTGFTRIIIVLSLLRQAMGTQTTPPNQVLIALSLFLTLFVMGPVFDKVYDEAWQPYTRNEISFDQALARAEVPVKKFMLRQTRESDLALFVRLARVERPRTTEDLSLRIVVPAFATSELKTAFQIGFMIFVPFIVIDLVVASVLMSMGMMMLSPVLISLPFKLMLFVLVDGWNLMLASLVASFGAVQ